MTRQFAFWVFLLSVGWLFYQDQKKRPALSSALWVPLIWAVIIGSRPVSLWFSGALQWESSPDDQEGSALDRNVFLALILAGLWILYKRRFKWTTLFVQNKWLFLFYAFCAVSALWSDYPFLSFKRWTKIFGQIVMVLVILSESEPIEAIKAILLRAGFVLIPLSVVLIKYYPELGRGFSRFTYEPICLGAALGKNELGTTLVVCGLAAFWEFMELRPKSLAAKNRLYKLAIFAVLVMTGWLLIKAKSATSLACVILGVLGLFTIRLPSIQNRRQHLVAYSIVGLLALLLLSAVLDLGDIGTHMLGRDASLTGRTEIWGHALKEQSKPVVGEGFYTFWEGPRAEKLSEKYFFRINQAHNGYLETYLDLGAIGVILLIGVIIAAGKRIQKLLLFDTNWGTLAFFFWLIVIIHNWTEASFARLNLLWFTLLLVALEYKSSSWVAVSPVQSEPLPPLEPSPSRP